MEGTTAGGTSSVKRSRPRVSSSIQHGNHDILCMIFGFLDPFDVVRCSAVSKSWNKVINKYKYCKCYIISYKVVLAPTMPSSASSFSERSLKACIEQLAMEHQRLSFQGLTDIEQWKGHSIRARLCRMKRGLILTSGGDKVMCLWPLESYKCLEEHSRPDLAPLVDFAFDENKVDGTVYWLWKSRLNGQLVAYILAVDCVSIIKIPEEEKTIIGVLGNLEGCLCIVVVTTNDGPLQHRFDVWVLEDSKQSVWVKKLTDFLSFSTTDPIRSVVVRTNEILFATRK